MYGEIINPSDAYSIDCTDREAAAAAVLLLGEGKYAISLDGDQFLPLFFLLKSLDDIDSWWTEQFGSSLFGNEKINDRDFRERIAKALESVVIGDPGDRELFEEMVADVPAERRQEFKSRRHDKRRSSLNDIGGRAAQLAESMRRDW